MRVITPLPHIQYDNHGSWGLEPATMVVVVKRGEVDNVGIVYNFFHGHDQLDLMPDAFRAIGPYLMSIKSQRCDAGGA